MYVVIVFMMDPALYVHEHMNQIESDNALYSLMPFDALSSLNFNMVKCLDLVGRYSSSLHSSLSRF
jgi:hypothetical protein